MKIKSPYQRGSKRNIVKDTISIPIKEGILGVHKEHLLLKALEVEAYLWQVASDEEEARKITELLNKSI
ncbi:TPA: hypothetical protein ACGBG5_003438 [Enterococcus faecalis]